MKWLKTAGYVLAGLLAAIAFSILGRPGRQLKKAEHKEQQALADGSAKALKTAAKENAKATKHKVEAEKAAAVGIKAIEGVKDEKITDLISNWTKPN